MAFPCLLCGLSFYNLELNEAQRSCVHSINRRRMFNNSGPLTSVTRPSRDLGELYPPSIHSLACHVIACSIGSCDANDCCCFPCCYIHLTSPVVVSLVTMRVTSLISLLNNSLVSDHDLDLAVMAVHAQ